MSLSTVLLSAFAAGASATGAGIEASVSSFGLNYVVTQLLPLLEAEFGTVSIPDVNGNQDGFDYHLTSIKCDDFKIAAADLSLAPPSSLAVALSGIAITCSAGWSFKLHDWPHVPDGSGSADVSVSSTTAALGVSIGVASLRPTLLATSASLNIGSVDITLHGSAWDWLLNLFKSDLESAIRSALDKSFGPVLEKFIDTDANAALAKIPIEVPISARPPYNVSEARFGFVTAPVATASFLSFGVQGDVVPIGSTVEPPVPAPALPPFDATNYMVEGRFSPYTLTSAAWTYYQANLTNWPHASKDIPLGLNETDGYALIAPGLPKAFPHSTVSIVVAFSGLPSLTIAVGGISADTNLSLAFLVEPLSENSSSTAFILNAEASFLLDVGVSPSPLVPGSLIFNGTLSYIRAEVTLTQSSVGPVSVGLLQALVDAVLPIATSVLNGDLGRGFPLPPIEYLSFSNATSLSLSDGFASFSSNFTFQPQ
jgi:hypothetical protein